MLVLLQLVQNNSPIYRQAMHKDVRQYVQDCLVCQQAKTENTLPSCLLQPLRIPDQIRENLAMDFIAGLPSSNGFGDFGGN